MANEAGWKLLQKQTYDVLSHRYGSLALAAMTVLLIVSILQFGEQWLEWSQDKYAALFNSFNDNISGRSFQTRMCLPVPIDVVYTWVNGTDPKLIQQLRRYKSELESEINETSTTARPSDSECTFTHCVPSNMVMVVHPAGQQTQVELNLETFGLIHPIFYEAKSSNLMKTTGDGGLNVTVVQFDDNKKAKTAANHKIPQYGRNLTIQHGYLSSDWTIPNSILLQDVIIMTGFPHELTIDELKSKLPERHQKAIEKIDLFAEKGVAVLLVSNKQEFDFILQEHNITIEGKEPTFNAANLVWDLTWNRKGDDIGANRFEDNEELRYSLRSVETHAPWVRHIFVVTNGQIPSWMNLDNPRLTVVTHEQIFPNKTHLPTFSSPSIEAHLHRIPGLSDKFIYLNDDVMFGKDVWPDDFYTHSNGQKVYLTWPVPNCQDGCPSSWIKDGYCDKACNNSECEWDGGDCAGGAKQPYQFDSAHHGGWNVNSDELYCNTGCANNWIADRYCDQACNVKKCGYDAGDCGTKGFSHMHGIELNKATTEYSLPKGETVAWFNLTGVFGSNCTVDEGTYEENEAIRTATIAQKFKAMTIVVYDKYNATTLHFKLQGKLGVNDAIQYNFTVAVDPKPVKRINATNETAVAVKHELDVNGTLKVVTNVTKEKFKFEDIPIDLQSPKSVIAKRDADPVTGLNMSLYELPENIDEEFTKLLKQFIDGELTEKGFNTKQGLLWKEYSQFLASEGKQPLRKTSPKPSPPLDGDKKIESVHRNNLVGEERQENVKEQKQVQNFNQPQDGRDQPKLDHLQQQNPVDQPVVQQMKQNLDIQQQPVVQQVKQNEQQPVVQQVKQNEQQPVVQQVKQNLDIQQQPVLQQMKQNQDIQQQPVVQQVKQSRDRQQQPFQQHGQMQHEEPGNQIDQQHFDGYLNGKLKEKTLHDNVIPENLNDLEQHEVDHGDRQEVKFEQGAALKQPTENPQPQGAEQVKENDQVDTNVKNQQDAYAQDNSFKSRKLNAIRVAELPSPNTQSDGFLPWEKQRVFDTLIKKRETLERLREFEITEHRARKLLDTFGDSLRHVNKLYNNLYGYSARKVPAHMPHFIDKNIMAELHEKFPHEWDVTSSHKIRSSDDMQFAFSYMYYLMSEPKATTVQQVFREYDNDHSGILSDREIRTMATRLYELPLDLQTLTGLEKIFINCSEHLAPEILTMPVLARKESYYDKEMPQVTEYLILHCEPIIDLMRKNIKQQNKYRFEILSDDDVAFKMIHTNVSHVVGQLDDVRKHPKKFICLNDNIDHAREEAKTVKAVLADFYESIFPIPSSFELPRDYRNRFLTIDELHEWRKYRDWLKMWTHLALFLLITFTVGSFFSDKLEAILRKILGRRGAQQVKGEASGGAAAGRKAVAEGSQKIVITV